MECAVSEIRLAVPSALHEQLGTSGPARRRNDDRAIYRRPVTLGTIGHIRVDPREPVA